MNRKEISKLIKDNQDRASLRNGYVMVPLCEGYMLRIFKATSHPLTFGKTYVEVCREKDNQILALAPKYPANCMTVSQAPALLEAYFAKEAAKRAKVLDGFTVEELQAAIARKQAQQPEAWTDGVDGTPYMWTSHQSAKAAADQLQKAGVPCKAFKVESYAYGVQQVGKSDVMVSQAGCALMGLPY